MKRGARGLRVLLTADSVGGVWTYALDLAAGLAAKGAEVIIAHMGLPPTEPPALSDGVEIVFTGLPLDWGDVDADALSSAGQALADLTRVRDVDLVHLNSPILAADVAFHVPVVGGCHSCVATWWDAVEGHRPLPADFIWRTDRLRAGYAACDALIAPTRSFAEATTGRYGQPCQVVWNGRTPPSTGPLSGPRRPVAVTAGRLWDPAKGAATLDTAAGKMRARVEAAGPLANPFDPRPVSFAHLNLLGRLSPGEVAELLSNSAAFVSAARYEPFGLSVLEAAQAGCALVLSDLPVFRELWDGAAVFVDPTDTSALAETLDALLDDPAETRRLGELAHTRAGRFSLDVMLAGTLAIYADVLDRAARPSEAAA
ncbi:MAG TPA: glycosyltransferase family 4 protein [Brevundimonas sp.]|jgi:glycosyltransferase involved in cell wall biosynthesis